MKVKAIIICTFFSVSFVFGQTYSDLSFSGFIKDYSALLNKQPQANFSVLTTSKLYKDTQSNELFKKETGYLIQGTGTYQLYQSEGSTHLQNDEVRIEIDSAQELVIASYPVNLAGRKWGQEFFSVLDSLQYSFAKAEDKKYIYFRVIELQKVSSNQEVVLRFNKESHELSQISILYWPSNYFSTDLNDEVLEQPHLVIDYSSYKTLVKANEMVQKEMDLWVSKKDKTYLLVTTKMNYKFNDLRVSSPSK